MGLLWARTIATHGPVLCLFTAMHVPLDCHSVPVDCHMWASCLPHRCLLSATCGPDNGHMWASRGPALQNACGPQVCLTWELFQLPHVGLVWPTCRMFAGVLKYNYPLETPGGILRGLYGQKLKPGKCGQTASLIAG